MAKKSSPSQKSASPEKAALHAVLHAVLAPGLTVEDASHARVRHLPESDRPPAAQISADRLLLARAGLDYVRGYDVPDAIVLKSARLFKQAFPDLAYAVPILVASQGVQPYTDGLPKLAIKDE